MKILITEIEWLRHRKWHKNIKRNIKTEQREGKVQVSLSKKVYVDRCH